MNYRSVADLNDDVIAGLPLIPADVELVVGIPRSGLLAGTLVALALNVPLPMSKASWRVAFYRQDARAGEICSRPTRIKHAACW